MPLIFYAQDNQFAASTGDNVNTSSGQSRFDNPPTASKDLVITAKDGDPDPRVFEIGDTYDIEFGGIGHGVLIDAVVVRSDPAPDGVGGVIVFEGTNEAGELTHVIWTPDFDLEGWYNDNYNPSAEPEFYTTDANASYNHEFICFAGETRIETRLGGIPAAEIWEGDQVLTLDHAEQPVRWVGRRRVRGAGKNAPVLFAPGTIGNHTPLRLSQQHRVLIRSPVAELLFAAPEVLVPAKALVNGEDIQIKPCKEIEYVHLLFDAHHVIKAEGAPCESLLVGDMAAALAGDIPDHLNIAVPAARPILRYVEAVALVGGTRVRRKPALVF